MRDAIIQTNSAEFGPVVLLSLITRDVIKFREYFRIVPAMSLTMAVQYVACLITLFRLFLPATMVTLGVATVALLQDPDRCSPDLSNANC